MDEVLLMTIFLLFVVCWRGITMGDNSVANGIQKLLHCCGPVAALLQWYTILFIGSGLFLARTFGDIVFFDFVKAKFLRNTPFLWKVPEADQDIMEITPWLRVMAIVAPVCGVLAGVLVLEHGIGMVRANAQRKREQLSDGAAAVWATSKELSMVLYVIAMPIVFVLMSMRAEIRILAVMTGSLRVDTDGNLPWTHDQVETPEYQKAWATAKILEGATYKADLEIAGFFQYMTIFSFGRLCISYLRNAPDQYRMALKWAALQGVYMYVAFGMLRCLATFANVILTSVEHESKIGALIQDKVLTFLGPIFTVATVLCVYNMIIICGMTDVKNNLGNANLKFQGTRFLVLVTQVQQGVLLGLVAGGSIYNMLENSKLPPWLHQTVQSWNFSEPRAELLHACLLNIECLLVALFNRCVWDRNVDYSKMTKVGDLAEPLLEVEQVPA